MVLISWILLIKTHKSVSLPQKPTRGHSIFSMVTNSQQMGKNLVSLLPPLAISTPCNLMRE